MPAYELTNALPSWFRRTYLELGLRTSENFQHVRAAQKYSVDIRSYDHCPPPTHHMTTDEFFQLIPADLKFDCIYIDACHEYAYVLRDFNNSAQHLGANGLLLIHDLVPPNESFLSAEMACGDGFRLLHQLWDNPGFRFYVQDGDCGLTALIQPPQLVEIPEKRDINYAQFMADLATRRRYTNEEMLDVVRNLS